MSSKKSNTQAKRATPSVAISDDSTSEEVLFYRADEKPFGVFSNLHRTPIEFEGETYPTAEHAYQAGKPRNEKVRRWLMDSPSPSLLAMAAHGLYKWDIVNGWNEIKFDRMRRVLRAKFTQHPELREVLLSTGESAIVEAPRTDSAVNRLWGRVNGKGKNMLGVMLMELRTELRKSTRKGAVKKKSTTKRSNRRK